MRRRALGHKSIPLPIPLANCVSHWPLDSDGTDTIGSNSLDEEGTMSYPSGVVSNCADFTGSASAALNKLMPSGLNFGNGTTNSPFSISLWVKFNSISGAATIFSHRSATQVEYDISYNSSLLKFRCVSNGNAANSINCNYTITPTIGQWYHIVATNNGSGSASGLNLYVDKVSGGSKFETGTYVAMNAVATHLYLGKFISNESSSLNGYLDEVYVFDIELDSTQVDYCYDKGIAGETLF